MLDHTATDDVTEVLEGFGAALARGDVAAASAMLKLP